MRIAEDGEILARGPNIMRGYWQNDEATRQTLTQDGWLKTGDIGRLDADGYLYVTDRKKEILVTAGGKNVPPQPIEEAVCNDAFIEQFVVLGDGRPFIAALIVPAWGRLEPWARENGLDPTDRAALVQHPTVVAHFRGCIDKHCEHLASFETVKQFAILENELSIESGELTPTMKVKRRIVEDRHSGLIEALYAKRKA